MPAPPPGRSLLPSLPASPWNLDTFRLRIFSFSSHGLPAIHMPAAAPAFSLGPWSLKDLRPRPRPCSFADFVLIPVAKSAGLTPFFFVGALFAAITTSERATETERTGATMEKADAYAAQRARRSSFIMMQRATTAEVARTRVCQSFIRGIGRLGGRESAS